LLRAEAVVAVADSLAHLVEQPGRSQRGTHAWFHRLVSTPFNARGRRQFLGVQVLMCSRTSRLFVTVLGYPS
jgi:hypothetical protein